VKLSDDEYAGGSHHPMWWNGRIYFITDRDGIMNIWSMTEAGSDLQQHTDHDSFDIRYASLHNGQIVYQHAADIWKYNISSNTKELIPITLASDLEQLREKWVKDPSNYITDVHLHPNGDQVVITARGRVFVAPVKDGRLVQLSRKEGVRYRSAVFSNDGKNILTLSDESGEFEFVSIPSSGIGNHKPLTNDGEIIRFTGSPSPDGKWLAYNDYNRDVWLLNIQNGSQQRISTNRQGNGDISWSPDSKWVSFVQSASNSFGQIMIFGIDDGSTFPLTTDRANSMDPSWSPDGKFIYFLSDRNFQSLVGSPWGSRQPEPYFDRKFKLYHIALQAGTRSPFQPTDELFAKEKEEKSDAPVIVQIDRQGLQQRIKEVPLSPGNYMGLGINDKALYFLSRGTGIGAKTNLMALEISNNGDKAETMVEDVRRF
jgi:tricorn protease